ncbi:MAG TPA: hypothetical protein VN253_24890 [Kofleriaceae bacterium]|nr:hypothetical protein [Kofleriaceae bacterium]
MTSTSSPACSRSIASGLAAHGIDAAPGVAGHIARNAAQLVAAFEVVHGDQRELTREDLVRLARQAVSGINRPTYCHNPPAFDPHEWVLDAMLLAFRAGAGGAS